MRPEGALETSDETASAIDFQAEEEKVTDSGETKSDIRRESIQVGSKYKFNIKKYCFLNLHFLHI